MSKICFQKNLNKFVFLSCFSCSSCANVLVTLFFSPAAVEASLLELQEEGSPVTVSIHDLGEDEELLALVQLAQVRVAVGGAGHTEAH